MAMATAELLDPDRLAELEEQRDFLLRSLEDLEREHDAGDLDEHDYAELRDDYTRRAAEVLRAIEARRAAFAEAPRRSRTRWILGIGGVVAVAAVAGIFLASALGFRSSGDSLTGDIRQATRGQLLEAQELLGAGELDEADAVYDEVLERDPSNAEALAYKGWVAVLRGDAAGGERLLADAVDADPDYVDAHVFRAITLTRLGRFDEASGALAAFDALNPPPGMAQLVDASGIRAELLAVELVESYGPVGTPVDVADIDAPVGLIVDAARLIRDSGDFEIAVRLLDAVLDADPDNVGALISLGSVLATPDFADAPDVIDRGVSLLRRATELAPDEAEPWFWLALGLSIVGEGEEASEAYGRFRANDPSDALVDLAERLDLEGRIADLDAG